MRIMYHVVLDKSSKMVLNRYMIKTDKPMTTYTLPAELASGFINNDWSILDYIDDAEYTKCVDQFCQQLDYDGVSIVDADVENVSFVKYHDLSDYGVKAAMCCTFTAV